MAASAARSSATSARSRSTFSEFSTTDATAIASVPKAVKKKTGAQPDATAQRTGSPFLVLLMVRPPRVAEL